MLMIKTVQPNPPNIWCVLSIIKKLLGSENVSVDTDELINLYCVSLLPCIHSSSNTVCTRGPPV